ncbi:MAG: methyl-accepting chemotaxis protein [Coleofasciculaceae cyanobacterium]
MNKHFSTPNFSKDSNGHHPKEEQIIANQDEPKSSLNHTQEIPFDSTQKTSLQRHSSRGWRFASLRTKATIIAIAIGTLPVLAIASSAYFVVNQRIEEQVLQYETSDGFDLEDKLNLFVSQRYDDVQAMAKLDAFSNPKVRDILTREEKNEILNSYLKTYQFYDSIIVYDLQGNALAQSDGDVAANYLNFDYTQAVLKTDRPYISEPRLSTATNIFSFFAAAPIRDKATGKTIAIVRTRVPMTIVQSVLGVKASREQKFYITDSNGQIVAADKPDLLQKKLEAEYPQLTAKIKQSDGKALTTIGSDQGVESILTYVPNEKLSKSYNLRWSILLARPTSVAFAVQRQLFLTFLLGTALTTALVAVIGAIIAKRATRPILEAAKAVDQIGRGELDTRLEVAGDDELSVLEANINQMATQLKMLVQEQSQVAEEQRQLKEGLQQRALELLMEVDPISKGDLTTRATVTADEIGTIADSYNVTVSSLRKIVTKVQDAASLVARTTSTNEVSVRALSSEALRQAEEIAIALIKAQEMADSVQQVAASAALADQAVKRAATTVQEGDAAMNRTVDGILAIRETVSQTAKKVKHLGESSQKISAVVNLIGTFAAQTNLLALNASIEAARAGEEGRGFAVVADEVRSLARQSADATSEIEKLVAAIQAETNEVVAAMEAGTEQVVLGTRLVDETRQSLNKITDASLQIDTIVEAIAQATVIQSQASFDVTQTMTNVAAIAEKTAKEASLVSSSFEQLLGVAQVLQDDVGQFKVS